MFPKGLSSETDEISIMPESMVVKNSNVEICHKTIYKIPVNSVLHSKNFETDKKGSRNDGDIDDVALKNTIENIVEQLDKEPYLFERTLNTNSKFNSFKELQIPLKDIGEISLENTIQNIVNELDKEKKFEN
ncbi:hypothetical protein CEXT_211851 [Caerostris extrusa]|uniref:Uncharacterized protein n=1 Tax=Caerostris extrusa TaxID=172846 RepID=A0AAV4PIA1_CAEEX|nr:hypothetical protein CEXT_211851 [Caerostris extrusa]